jgi:transposase
VNFIGFQHGLLKLQLTSPLLLVSVQRVRAYSMEPDQSHFRFYAATRQRLGISATSVHEELRKAWGNAAPAERTVYLWFQEFKEDQRTSFTDKPRSGRPTTTRTVKLIEDVENLIKDDPHLSTRDVADLLDVDHSTVLRILRDDLELRCVCSVWIPHRLSEENRRQRVNCAKQLRRELVGLGDDRYDLYAVEDETWVYWEPFRTKSKNRTWIGKGEPRHRALRTELTAKKTLLLVSFTPNKRFSVSATPTGNTIDAQAMVDFIRRTGDLWRTLRSNPIHLSNLRWQMDNARPHAAKLVQDFLQHRRATVLWQSPYSPDLNLCDRFLFPWLKSQLRKTVFYSTEEVETNSLQVLRGFSEDAMRREVDDLIDHCQLVIEANGDYITP